MMQLTYFVSVCPFLKAFSIEYLSISLFLGGKISVNEVYHIDFLSKLLRKGVIFFFKRRNKQSPSIHVSICVSSSIGRVTYKSYRNDQLDATV